MSGQDILSLDDPVWATLEGGYRIQYDASTMLRRIAAGDRDSTSWSELWEELHHQSDVGTASYASVIALARVMKGQTRDWNFYGIVSVIESSRLFVDRNPAIPDWMQLAYSNAWDEILKMAADDIVKEQDSYGTRAIVSAIYAAKGDYLRASLIDFADDDIKEMLGLNRVVEPTPTEQVATDRANAPKGFLSRLSRAMLGR
jgi:hypothetical protein